MCERQWHTLGEGNEEIATQRRTESKTKGGKGGKRDIYRVRDAKKRRQKRDHKMRDVLRDRE